MQDAATPTDKPFTRLSDSLGLYLEVTRAGSNLRRYVIRDALQVTLLRFEDSAYALKGQVGFLAIARAGGNLVDTTAVKSYQHSAT